MLNIQKPLTLPVADELHVAVWRDYAAHVAKTRSIDGLAQYLPQLRFPIRAGMKRDPGYRAATRHGSFSSNEPAPFGFALNRPADVTILVHDTPAGGVPVITAADRSDFGALACALVNGNEPRPLPDAFGGCMVTGFTNWHRLHLWCRVWQVDHQTVPADEQRRELLRAVRNRDLSKDRFLMLSDGPYSGVAASAMGVDDQEWRRMSLRLRIEHEATHYFTQRVLGATLDALQDEIIADWAAISAVTGRYRSDWFLRFMGLEQFPAYRSGGRLEHYCDRRITSPEEFERLQRLVREAARHLEAFDEREGARFRGVNGRALMIVALEMLTVDEMASPQALTLLAAATEHATANVTFRELGPPRP